MGTCSWEPVAGNLAWEPLPENIAWEPACWEPCLALPGNLFLETSSWKHLFENPVLGTLFCSEKHVPGNLACEPCWGPLAGNLAWEPVPGNLAWEPFAGEGTCSWEPLGNLYLGTCSWEPCLETLAGNLFLGTLLGNFFLGTRFPTLRRVDSAAPRDSLGKGNPSWEPGSQCCAVRIWLLRPAPKPLLWLKTQSLRFWGIKIEARNHSQAYVIIFAGILFLKEIVHCLEGNSDTYKVVG